MTSSARGERVMRERVIAAARQMNATGINRGRSGNVSARFQQGAFDGYLITPTGMAYEDLVAEDVVAMGLDGKPRDGEGRVPSSEWRLHGAIYAARPDAGAIVHAHSVFATTLACLHRPIPAFHYMIAAAGGDDIRCAPYVLFGTQELAEGAIEALRGRKACLLAQHGQLAIGADPAGALEVAIQVETLGEIYCRVLQIGEPKLLSAAEMALVTDKFATYGQQR